MNNEYVNEWMIYMTLDSYKVLLYRLFHLKDGGNYCASNKGVRKKIFIHGIIHGTWHYSARNYFINSGAAAGKEGRESVRARELPWLQHPQSWLRILGLAVGLVSTHCMVPNWLSIKSCLFPWKGLCLYWELGTRGWRPPILPSIAGNVHALE